MSLHSGWTLTTEQRRKLMKRVNMQCIDGAILLITLTLRQTTFGRMENVVVQNCIGIMDFAYASEYVHDQTNAMPRLHCRIAHSIRNHASFSKRCFAKLYPGTDRHSCKTHAIRRGNCQRNSIYVRDTHKRLYQNYPTTTVDSADFHSAKSGPKRCTTNTTVARDCISFSVRDEHTEPLVLLLCSSCRTFA